MLSPTVMVVNDGSGSGSFANIGCTLHGGQERIEFSVPTINVPQGFGVPAVPQAFVGSSLEPNGVFLNSINCRSREIDEDLADEYADLLLSAQTFFRMVPGFNCGLQYAHRNVQLPQNVTQDLERFFDKNFSLTPDGYRFSLYVSDLENTEVAAFAAWITLTENAVQRLRNQKELLKYGFGTVCPPPPEASVEVLLRYQSIET